MLSDDVIINRVLGTWALVLVVLGIIGNSLCLHICMRPRLREIPTFVFLSFLAVANTITLFGWNLNHFIQAYWDFIQEDLSKFMCRFIFFYQCFTLEASAWFLVIMCLEQYLCAKITTWRKSYFNWQHSLVLSFLLVAVFMALNVHVFFTVDYKVDTNSTRVVGICYSSSMWKLWREVHSYIYSIVPFVFLAVINAMLLYQTVFVRVAVTSNTARKRQKTMTRSLLTLTAIFFLFTAPNAIVGIFIPRIFSSTGGRNILFLCNNLGFTYHSLNILVFLFVNKQFQREFKKLLCGKSKYKDTSLVVTQQVTPT